MHGDSSLSMSATMSMRDYCSFFSFDSSGGGEADAVNMKMASGIKYIQSTTHTHTFSKSSLSHISKSRRALTLLDKALFRLRRLFGAVLFELLCRWGILQLHGGYCGWLQRCYLGIRQETFQRTRGVRRAEHRCALCKDMISLENHTEKDGGTYGGCLHRQRAR